MKALKVTLLTLGFLSGTLALALHFYDSPVRAREWRLERVEENRRATVLIINESASGKRKTFGSGVVISRAGTILTAAHIAEKESVTYVVQKRGREFDIRLATPVIVDKESQLAILFTDRGFDAQVTFGRSRDLRDGDLIYTIGHPGGIRRPIVDAGVVSQRYFYQSNDFPRFTTLVKISGAPGMSGSPIFNQDGELVGIYNAIIGFNTLSTVPHGQLELWGMILSTDEVSRVIQDFFSSRNPQN